MWMMFDVTPWWWCKRQMGSRSGQHAMVAMLALDPAKIEVDREHVRVALDGAEPDVLAERAEALRIVLDEIVQTPVYVDAQKRVLS
jgi:hypothetical protein